MGVLSLIAALISLIKEIVDLANSLISMRTTIKKDSSESLPAADESVKNDVDTSL